MRYFIMFTNADFIWFLKILLLHGGVNPGKDKAYYSFPSSHFVGLKLLQQMK